MKLIMINEENGGDKYIQIFEMNTLQIEKEMPEIGFFTYKDTEMYLSGEIKGVAVHSLYRKRNIMKYITKLFQKRKKK